MTNSEKAALSRRTFVKGSALAGLGAAAMGSTSLFGCAPQGQGDAEGADLAATGETAPVDEKIVWTHCHVNCGGACVLQCHVADDEIVSVESDNTGDASFGGFQARACLRGRSIRRWINGEDRLNYPMKRVEGSKRGEGKYEQISWDEALDTIASEFKRITEAYGNESVLLRRRAERDDEQPLVPSVQPVRRRGHPLRQLLQRRADLRRPAVHLRRRLG